MELINCGLRASNPDTSTDKDLERIAHGAEVCHPLKKKLTKVQHYLTSEYLYNSCNAEFRSRLVYQLFFEEKQKSDQSGLLISDVHFFSKISSEYICCLLRWPNNALKKVKRTFVHIRSNEKKPAGHHEL